MPNFERKKSGRANKMAMVGIRIKHGGNAFGKTRD